MFYFAVKLSVVFCYITHGYDRTSVPCKSAESGRWRPNVERAIRYEGSTICYGFRRKEIRSSSKKALIIWMALINKWENED